MGSPWVLNSWLRFAISLCRYSGMMNPSGLFISSRVAARVLHLAGGGGVVQAEGFELHEEGALRLVVVGEQGRDFIFHLALRTEYGHDERVAVEYFGLNLVEDDHVGGGGPHLGEQP